MNLRLETTIRIAAINRGMEVTVPGVGVEVVLQKGKVGGETILGKFATREEAVHFLLTGAVRRGATAADVMRLTLGSRAGYFRLNKSEVIRLLVTGSIQQSREGTDYVLEIRSGAEK